MTTSSPHSARARISSRPPPPIGVVVPTRDPMARVMDLDKKRAMIMFVAGFIAYVLHGAVAARAAMMSIDLIHWTHNIGALVSEKLWSTYDVDMFKAPEDKAPPPEPEPEKEAEKPPPPVALPKDAPKDEPPPAPTPAQAGQVLTAPDEPLDFTGQGFTQGTAATYAGGVTHAQGTSTAAVRNVAARPDGVPGGTGAAPAPPPPAVDKSRAAGLRGSSEWKCPWPSEADAEQIDEAYVTVQVSVGPDGRAKTVSVMADPGHGFGREARLCAMRETYTTALDKDGTAIAGQTKAFRIHFER